MTESSSFGLSEKAIASVHGVLKNCPSIKQVIIYGSRAIGNYREGSDIDLAVVAPDLTTTELFKIENQIDDLMLPYKFDICLLHHVDNQNLVDHIKRVGKNFYTRL